jgi:hypothetical protein
MFSAEVISLMLNSLQAFSLLRPLVYFSDNTLLGYVLVCLCVTAPTGRVWLVMNDTKVC